MRPSYVSSTKSSLGRKPTHDVKLRILTLFLGQFITSRWLAISNYMDMLKVTFGDEFRAADRFRVNQQ
jgi:hypothetical protein